MYLKVIKQRRVIFEKVLGKGAKYWLKALIFVKVGIRYDITSFLMKIDRKSKFKKLYDFCHFSEARKFQTFS